MTYGTKRKDEEREVVGCKKYSSVLKSSLDKFVYELQIGLQPPLHLCLPFEIIRIQSPSRAHYIYVQKYMQCLTRQRLGASARYRFLYFCSPTVIQSIDDMMKFIYYPLTNFKLFICTTTFFKHPIYLRNIYWTFLQ